MAEQVVNATGRPDPQQYLTQLLDHAPIGVVRVDLRGRVSASNHFGCQILGGPEAELIGIRFRDFFSDGEKVEALVARCLLGGGDPDPLIVEKIVSDQRRAFELRGIDLKDIDGVNGAMVLIQDVTERVLQERDREEDLWQIEFLADASGKLALSLQLNQVFERFAEIVVPLLADWVAIDLVDREGGLRRIVVRHADANKAHLIESLKDYPPRPGSHPLLFNVPSDGRPTITEVDEALLVANTYDDEHRRILEELGTHMVIATRLEARKRLLGSIMFVSSGHGRHYGQAELALAQDLAQRAALAMDNARLFQEQVYVARKLQESLLPPTLPDIPGLDVAARYSAAGEGVEVGGDFYDLFRTGGKYWGIVMGDVCGKGPDAAAVTALARYTIRAAAMQVRSPRRILRMLNDAILEQTTGERFATATFVRIEGTEEVGPKKTTVSCGGHPAALVLRAKDGSVEEVGAPGTILGVLEDADVSESHATLHPGDTMLLYTDGVTEARSGDRLLGLYGVKKLLRSCAGLKADEMAQRIQDHVLDYQSGEPRDDIAILVMRVLDRPLR